MSSATFLLFEDITPQTARESVSWWELRRIPYNVVLGVIGLASILAMLLIAERVLPAGDDMVEPLVLILFVLVYGIGANTCYTLGWFFEIIFCGANPKKKTPFRLVTFWGGFAFSCLLTTLPVWLGLQFWARSYLSSILSVRG